MLEAVAGESTNSGARASELGQLPSTSPGRCKIIFSDWHTLVMTQRPRTGLWGRSRRWYTRSSLLQRKPLLRNQTLQIPSCRMQRSHDWNVALTKWRRQVHHQSPVNRWVIGVDSPNTADPSHHEEQHKETHTNTRGWKTSGDGAQDAFGETL